MALEQINGIVPIVPTPFNADGAVDAEALADLVRFAAAGGCQAVCLPAYASEFYKLSEAERLEVVQVAVKAVGGSIAVIGQANHPAAVHAAAIARAVEAAGADAVAVAVPRMFALPERDLFQYFATILESIHIPLLIQDFNPGGATVTPAFVAELHQAFPHFKFLKLEEPLMAGKVKALVDATENRVGVLEGWGGLYMLELLEAGICGVMPGLAVSDLLARSFALARGGKKVEAYDVLAGVLPQIVFSLQSMEFFHHAEKRLLAARGILQSTHVRQVTVTPDPVDAAHIDFLNARILALLDRLKMPRNPSLTR